MSSNNREYSNSEIKVFWKPDLCNHSEICFKNLPRVFNPKRRPWVNLETSDNKRIIDVVNMCPSGALSYKYLVDFKNIKPELSNIDVKIIENGPIFIKGNIRLLDNDGNLVSEHQKLTLCRCGASEKMPFCDGSHKKINFKG